MRKTVRPFRCRCWWCERGGYAAIQQMRQDDATLEQLREVEMEPLENCWMCNRRFEPGEDREVSWGGIEMCRPCTLESQARQQKMQEPATGKEEKC